MASIRVLEKSGFLLQEEFVEEGRASKYYQYDQESLLTDQLMERAADYIRELFRGNVGGHDVEHTMRVLTCGRETCYSSSCRPGRSRRRSMIRAFMI